MLTYLDACRGRGCASLGHGTLLESYNISYDAGCVGHDYPCLVQGTVRLLVPIYYTAPFESYLCGTV